jgi:hypothetical protein
LPVGSSNLFLYKAKPIVRWGRKATGLEFPVDPIQGIFFFLKDSRAAEYDIVKITPWTVRFFYWEFDVDRGRR